MKKLLSMVLIFLLLFLTIFSVPVFAAQEGEEMLPPEFYHDEDDETLSGYDLAPVSEPGDEELHVPKIVIVTDNNDGLTLTKDIGYVDAHAVVTDTDGTELESDMLLKVRGNSTAFYTILKKPYTIKFPKKQELFNMGKGKKWALLSNPYDPTLMRNYIALELAGELGLEYTSKQKFSELWLDGSFRGLYTVTVPVEEGKDRVNIDIEGNGGKKDFLIEVEATREEDDVSYFKAGGVRFAAKDPDEPDEEQLAYMQSTMEDIISAVKSGDEEKIREKIDVASFEKFYLLNEYVKTVDLDFSSVFFYYKDGKLYAGPAWDYDFALGGMNPAISSNYRAASSPQDAYASSRSFFKYLCRNAWFKEESKKLFEEHYSYIYRISSMGGQLDSLKEEYASEIDRNFTVAGWKVNKWYMNYQKQPLLTYDENFDFLKDWCRQRQLWMAKYINPFSEDYLVGDVDGDGVVSVIDATMIQRVLAKMMTDEDGMFSLKGDADLDGLDVTDATYIQKMIAMISNDHHIGEHRPDAS